MFMRFVLSVIVAIATTSATGLLRAEVIEKTYQGRGAPVRYKVVLPNGYDPGKTYPAVIALGGGSQTMNAAEGILNRVFRAEAEKRGYIVIAPAAPPDHLVLWDGSEIFPEFFTTLLSDYKIQDNKFHIAGSSNGGIAALEIAAVHPQYFLSVTGFPGYLEEPRPPKLTALSKMCVYLYVGELDDDVWHREMKREAEVLTSLGAVARYVVESGQPHSIQSLAGANAGRLFDGFEQTRKGCTQ